MKRKTRKALRLTAEHAARAIHALIAHGELKARDVTSALKRRRKLIKELKERLAAQEGGTIRAAAKVARRKKIARSTRSKASKPGVAIKTAVARSQKRHPGTGARPGTVEASTKKIARSTRSKASRSGVAIKTAVARMQEPHPGTGAGPNTVEASTKTVAREAATEQARPDTSAETRSDTSAPARRAEGHGLPALGNPEHEGMGTVGVLRDSRPQS